MLESRTPGGSVSWIRLWVLLEIQLLMASRACSGSACGTGLALGPKADLEAAQLGHQLTLKSSGSSLAPYTISLMFW